MRSINTIPIAPSDEKLINNITDLENLGSGIDFEAISKLPSNVIFLSIFLQKLVTNLYHNIYTKKLA